MTEYSVEEVRARFEVHYGISWESIQTMPIGSGSRLHLESHYKRHFETWQAAYAERFEADEGAGPVGNLDVIRDVIGELRSEAPKRPSAHYLADKLEAAIAAQPRAVPDGWALVPREPTQAMIDKGTDEHQCEQGDSYYASHLLSDGDAVAIYKAMLAAAPSPGESNAATKEADR